MTYKENITATIASGKECLLRDPSTISPAIFKETQLVIQRFINISEMLLEKCGLNSGNSSIPPSADPHRSRRGKTKIDAPSRSPGGQPGHRGATLNFNQNPDEIISLPVDRSTLPKGSVYKSIGFVPRQVIEVSISKKVIEYRAEILEDENGNRVVAKFPEGVEQAIQYGAGIKSLAVYVSQFQLIPYARVQEFFRDQFGISISTGSFFNFNKEVYELLEVFESIVKKKLLQQSLLHADETGINLNKKLLWLHSLSNKKWSFFYPHARRGGVAMKEIGVLENFHGILCHDHWKPYFSFKCEHALCNAHHLRELERAWEQDKQNWAKEMQEFLLKANKATEQSGGSLDAGSAAEFYKKYNDILLLGEIECPPPVPKGPIKAGPVAKTKSRNLLERLKNFSSETLRFMTNETVPFTNNQG